MDTISIPAQTDSANITSHLERLTRRWHEIGADQWLSLEIRMIARGSSPVPLKYRPDADGIQMAVDDIIHWNAKGRNAYVCVNPLKENVGGSATDADIAAAFYVFADCDDEASGNALKVLAGPKYSHVVLTGTVPHPRPHPYWELTQPQTDLDAWSDMQRRIAAALGSDRAVVNPSRIMRIAGTVTWPDQKKQERGYVSEIATFIDKGNPPVEWSSLERAFAQAAPQTAHTPLSALAAIDTGPKPLDRQTVATAALSGQDWHNNIIRLVASYVRKGLTDPEIHAITDAMTLPGYSVEETRREVQTAIEGARAKGFAPAPDATEIPPGEPIPLVREIPPGEPYPMDALGPLREAAEAAQALTQAPPALAAQSALSVASLAAQAHWNVETLGGPMPVSVFALSIAQSGERKSACDKHLKRPVDEFCRDLADEHRTEAEKHKAASALWHSRHKDILKKPNAEGAEADLAALGPEPEPPLLPLVLASDPTVEGITKHLGVSRPSLGLFSDEGGAFLGGSGMSADNRMKTVAALSGFWDGGAINRTRAGDGAVTHYGKRLSLHLMAQPVAAETLLADPIATGQGFISRFLIVEPPSTMGTRLYREPKPESRAALDRWGNRIGALLRAEPRLRDGTRNELDPPVMPLDPAARELLVRFHDTVEAELPAGKALETCRAFASKAPEHAARIAGVMAAFSGAQSVSAKTMADAITLAGFYLGEAVRLADAATISKETADLERLRKWLTGSWDEDFISPAISAQCGPFRETGISKRLLKQLAEYGHVSPIEGGAMVRGTHRREAFRIVRA